MQDTEIKSEKRMLEQISNEETIDSVKKRRIFSTKDFRRQLNKEANHTGTNIFV